MQPYIPCLLLIQTEEGSSRACMRRRPDPSLPRTPRPITSSPSMNSSSGWLKLTRLAACAPGQPLQQLSARAVALLPNLTHEPQALPRCCTGCRYKDRDHFGLAALPVLRTVRRLLAPSGALAIMA